MVTWVCAIPSVVGGHDGPDDLWEASFVEGEVAVYGGVFWEYWIYAVFFARGKSFPFSYIL